MDLPVNTFKRAISAGRTIFGAWLSSGTAATAEAMGCVGFDFLVIDMEHAPVDAPQMVDVLRGVNCTAAAYIVRLPWNDMVMVKRALDSGAQSVMMPFVQNAEEAARAVAYAKYPPAGVRGVAGLHRASRYSTVPNYLKLANDEICVTVQIETLQALDRLPEIAAVPGVDSIFIGPSDLAASMGLLGDIGNAAVQQKLQHGAQLCRKLGKPCGIIGTTPELVETFAGYGYDWIAVGSDMGFMVGRAQEMLGKARGLAPKAQGSK